MKTTLCAGVLMVSVVALAPGASLYVSPTGNDGNDGFGPGDASALRTIQAAVDRAQPGDTVLVRGGTYRETVVFPRSGTAAKPITVRALAEPRAGDTTAGDRLLPRAARLAEPVVVSGCDPITGWTVHDAGKGVWKAPMPWTLGLGRNQVFAAGKVMIEARHPNVAEPGLGMYVSDLSPLWPTFAEMSIPDAKAAPGRITGTALEGFPDDHWKGACYYGVHYEGWAAQTGVIEASKPGEITLTDRTRTWWFGSAYGGGYQPEEGRGMLVGHRNALDQPGEWHWQDSTLYLIPKDGNEPVAVAAKARQLAFDLSGREHIRLEGVTIRAASLRLEGSAFCRVDGCDLAYISHYTRHYDIGQIENGRNTIRSGETGIFVSGHDNAFLDCSVRISAGAGFYLRGYHHTIHNCLIDEVSYTSHYLNAITDAVSDFPEYENFLVGGHVITFNTMCNAGRHFFNVYGNGTSTASRDRGPMDYMATLFAHNHLYNGMLQTKDAGFITGYYSSGGTLSGLNTQIAYNVMHDCYDIFAMRINVLGIVYLDAGSCDVDLYNNLLWAAPGSLQRGLWYNTMCVDVTERDNVFHPNFERTCAELRPLDFPGARPFRFGHDFADPPARPQWPQLERRLIAPEDCPDVSAGVAKSAEGILGLADGGWVNLGDVDFGAGWQSAVMEFASDTKELNGDKAARARPRHRQATDPLVLEAVHNDGAQEKIRTQWTFIHTVRDGAWLRFNQVPLGAGYRRFRVIYGNDQETARRLEVRLDAVDGPLVGQVDLPRTDRPRGGRIQVYQAASGDVTPEATGTHDVFLVFRGEEGQAIGEFEYFRFEQYRGEIPLQKNEVRLELRRGSPTGEKMGEFFPRYTGGPDSFREMIATLEPATGVQPLFAVVRSALPGPLGTIGALRLEMARQPIDWSGIGVPPLMANGKPVYPLPTNRPCARPADKYPPRAVAGSSTRPRPIAVAARWVSTPVVDGSLGEWPTTTADRLLVLKESYDETATAAAPSEAWVSSDAGAFYIALRNPVSKATALLPSTHTWGKDDGVEVAFQDAFAKTPGPILTLYGFPDGHFTSEDYGGASAEVIARLQQEVSFAARVGDGEWTCEWRLPFAACGFTPATAPLLRFNLGVRKTAPEAWVVWRGTGGATYQVANGGLLAFPAEMLTLGVPTEKLEVWLDASDPATLQQDAAGNVAVWKDKSGKGRDARQDREASRPGFDALGLNGRPALRFDEKRLTRLELPDLSDGKLTGMVFAVISNPVAGAEVNHDPRIFTASNGKEFDYLIGIAATVPGMETGGPRLTLHGFSDRWAKMVCVGCFSPNVQTFFSGHIAEIVVYGRSVSAAEQERVRAYLAVKWGLD
jgi:hypothetical protein